MNLFKIATDQVACVAPMVDSYRLHGACMVPAWGLSHHWAGILFYIQLVLKIVTPCLTGLAFLTGPYSGVVQELAN